MSDVARLRAEVAACRVCAGALPLGPRPVLQIGGGARLLITSQAPGTKAHASGIPWTDASGDRLRDWLGMRAEDFYDPDKLAIVPMGFCYPGAVKGGGDLPPRPECAPLWHARLLQAMPGVKLRLLIGIHAQAAYLPARLPMTEAVRRARDFLPIFPLPHPSWRVVGWMRRNPWFEEETLPLLRAEVARALG
ncbi:MAG: IclR family transcriptional regulator [Proteobacteria bacterium SG_bin5]|nr:uracil-DNA glycosylase family protein [Sphingomonas sp.]OQW39685.1 MAG: IclR family transcriptional regulator [Proteobacteria bacterium SG_bin5]